MKKIVSFLLALVLTLSLTTNALAAVIVPAPDVTEAAAGQTVKLTVTASQDEPLTGVVCLNYRVYFDEEVVELDAAACTAGAEGVRLTEKKTAADGRTYYAVSLLDPASEGLTVTGDLYTLAFRVKDSALAGSETAFTVEKAHVYAIGDGALQPVDNGAVDSSTVTVKITSGIPADVTMTAAKAEEKGITVTWETAANAVTYIVYRKAAGDKGWSIIAPGVDGTSYTDTAVKAGETYTYTVRGVAADGKTTSKSYDHTGVTATAYSASAVPADVTMTAAKANIGSITVTWEAAEGARTYTVYRKAAGDKGWSIIALSVDGTSYTDTTPSVGTPYTYTVRGVAPDGKTTSRSYDHTGVTATMTAAVATPADVTMTAAKAATGSITVTWEAAEGAQTYTVYRKPAGTRSWSIIALGVAGTVYTDTAVSAGESYTYTVRGVASDGKTTSRSYDHDGVTASVPAARVPADVTMVSAKAEEKGITVTWETAANAVTYTVYRKAAGDKGWSIIALSVDGTSYTDTAVKAGETYTYTVRGVAADGKTTSKSYDHTGVTAVAYSGVSVPADVTMVSAKAEAKGITVTWKAAEGARTYTVYRKAAGDTGWSIIALSVAGTSYTDTAVKAGTTYTYTVRGVASDGKTTSRSYDHTGVTAAAYSGVSVPADVTMVSAKAEAKGITVTWKAAEGARTYTVYRKAAGDTGWSIIALNVAGTSYTDTAVKAGTTYTYTVRGVASDGKTTSRSYDHTGVTAAAYSGVSVPADVTMVSAKADSAGILVTWKAASAAQTYTVYRKLAGTSSWSIAAQGVTGTVWKDITAAKGTPYTYTVRGVASDGRTTSRSYDHTGVTDTVTKPSTTPADVTMVSARAGGTGITVTWEYALDARTYTVYRKAAGDTGWSIIALNVAGTSYTDTAVKAGTTYTYTVRGVAVDGKTTSRSYDHTGVTAAMPR